MLRSACLGLALAAFTVPSPNVAFAQGSKKEKVASRNATSASRNAPGQSVKQSAGPDRTPVELIREPANVAASLSDTGATSGGDLISDLVAKAFRRAL